MERGGCAGCGWREAYELDSEAEFDRLDLSVPRGGAGPLFKQTTLTFNPWDGSHWLKKRFFDRPHPDVFHDQHLSGQQSSWTSDIRVFEEMRQRHPRQYEVAGLGEWGTAEGLVFDRWRRQDFDLDRLPGRGIHRRMRPLSMFSAWITAIPTIPPLSSRRR